MSKRIVNAVLVLVAAVMCSTVLAADVPKAEPAPPLAIQLGAPFCDNAVLQREMEVPVWGWSKPGTKVTVQFAGQKKTAVAGKDGKWVVKLDKLKASFEPRQMLITGNRGKEVTLKNILVGEVWMASGQSNMQWTCTKSSVNKICGTVKPVNGVNPIREFRVNSVTSQLHPIEKAVGDWKDGNYLNYSAIAFAFAEKLYRELNVPIGILNCSFSQTAIQAWIPREGYASAEDDYSKGIHIRCLQTVPGTPEHKEAWAAFYKSLEDQIAASEDAIKKGEEAKKIGASVPGNMRGNRDANWLYNGKLHPVVPYAIRGAIWNQGYANSGEGLPYYNNLHSLVRGWRIVWDKPELPVYFHQFYCAGVTTKPGIGRTAEMRLGTWMARDIPNAGMASQIDISGGIHYSNKAVPGRRFALHALKNQYGKNVVAEGPMFKSYTVKGNEVTVEFDCAKGGLVVADTSFNRSREEGATGLADPKVIENGEDKVKLFWLAGEDRVWHSGTFEIKGDEVVVTAKGVKKPRGVSYGSGGIGFQPCLYNKALLPMSPFIQYDNKMVTSKWWPDEKLKIAGETIDPSTVGLIYEYRKMPILSVQFRDDAVLQADKPVTIWGSTRLYGEWNDKDEEGDCKIHFEFAPRQGSGQGKIKKTIPVTEGMAEWSVTLPPVKADGKEYTLKVQFTKDGELAHERIAKRIIFGDVWYVAAPAGIGGSAGRKKKKGGEEEKPAVSKSGQIVRMIENQSKRDKKGSPSRYSVCVSRTPRVIQANGKPSNRFASYWKPAVGLAGAIGNSIAEKTGRPVGIIFMQTKSQVPIKNWITSSFLNRAPSLMEDYKSVGSAYPDNPYYLANVRRYIADWRRYWKDYIPEMMETKAVPEGARWGASWGSYPSPEPTVGDSQAGWTYNVYVHCFAPAALSGVIFLAGSGMVEGDQGANFGPEMGAVAECLKTRFAGDDVPFFYTLPGKGLAPKITEPKIKGSSVGVAISSWSDVTPLIEKVVEKCK